MINKVEYSTNPDRNQPQNICERILKNQVGDTKKVSGSHPEMARQPAA
jgi:hypothetical protein